MEKNLYRLLKIEENTHPRYGDVFVVFANIATRRHNGTYSVSCLDGEDTELFVYPRVEEMIQPISVYGNNEKLWAPDPYDFVYISKVSKGRGAIHLFHLLLSFFKTNCPLELLIDYQGHYSLMVDEPWTFSLSKVLTPFGNLGINGVEMIDEGEVTGIQLDVSGSLDLLREKIPFARIAIDTVTLVRNSKEGWIQIALYDNIDERIINGGGYVDDSTAERLEDYFKNVFYSRH